MPVLLRWDSPEAVTMRTSVSLDSRRRSFRAVSFQDKNRQNPCVNKLKSLAVGFDGSGEGFNFGEIRRGAVPLHHPPQKKHHLS